jgi:glycosyltransferase involved in cell wall biosynthesis
MRIVAFAYACEPNRGSEPGAGWIWVRMLARLGHVCVITRANNREAIEAALPHIPERTIEFIYVDLPPWARFWKRGQRGIHLYYFLWQVAALRTARRLHRSSPFDLAWHVTMANMWFGSLAGLLGIRFVYGPVGGGLTASWRLVPALGIRGALYELKRAVVLRTSRFLNPLARSAWRKASLILVQNPESAAWIPERHRHKVRIFTNVVLDDIPARGARSRHDPPTALFAGVLMPLKGAALAIRTIALLPGWRLLLVGSGKDERRLRRISVKYCLEDRVEFKSWMPRDAFLRLMRDKADVLLFPSLHDQAAWVVGEAVTSGLPVVCLDCGAASMFGARAVQPTTPRRTLHRLAEEVSAEKFEQPQGIQLDLQSRFDALVEVLRAVGLLEDPAHAKAGESLGPREAHRIWSTTGPTSGITGSFSTTRSSSVDRDS